MNTAKIFPVSGMHCASCASIIKRKIEKLQGVESCEVNFGTEKANIKFDSDKVSVPKMNQEIEKLGYKLHEAHEMMTPVSADSSLKEQKLAEIEKLKHQVQIALPMVAVSVLVMAWEIGISPLGLLPKMPAMVMDFFQGLMPIFATYALFVIGSPYLLGMLRFFKYRTANMDSLVGIGTSVAFGYSFVMSVFAGSTESYYDVTIVVIGLITLGKFLEARSKLKTGEAIEKLISLSAKTALVIRNGVESEIPIEEVRVGDVCLVKPGQKIPVDGVVVWGNSSIDESMITGESMPIDKTEGELVIGATINKQGVLKIRASKIGSDTMLSQIIQMVEEAQGSIAPIERMADRVSAVFVPIVLVIAILVLVFWIVVGSPSLGILCFVGVLVIACPCAMGLATPTAVIVGVGKAAQNGILVKNAESLEKFSEVKQIVLDKTGTVTKGEPEVTEAIGSGFEILSSLEKHSEHPLSRAIVQWAKEKRFKEHEVKNFAVIEGKGVKGVINKKEYFAGSPRLAGDLNLEVDQKLIDRLATEGKTPIILMTQKEVLGYFGIADVIKPDAKRAIADLHMLGIKVSMLTGDNQKTAAYIAKRAGIDEVVSEVLPGDKANEIKKLQSSGVRVAMVGDGINDAPALATADVGVAMGAGTDVAIESAGITLLGGDLSKIPKAVKLSRATMRTIKQNLFWAFIYNIVGIPIAAGLLYPTWGILLSPAIAGGAMGLSSVFVVGNSLLLKKVRI